MQIEVNRIPEEGALYEGASEVVLADDPGEDDVACCGPVEYSLHAQFVDGELIIGGKIGADVTFRCSRCAEMARRRLVERAFSVVMPVSNGSESVDLTGEMREAILCAFPSHPVCSDDCRGLCPKCGANMNKGKCGCKPARDFRWESLDGLKL